MHSHSSGDSKYTEETFETLKHNVINLCHEIRRGEPDKVEHMRGGTHHRVLTLKFHERDPSEYILQLDKQGHISDYSADTKDEVALLEYLSTRLSVAKVCAFDARKRMRSVRYTLYNNVSWWLHG